MTLAGLGEIAEALRRVTVLVRAGNRGNGSGILWSSDGTVVTNAHVVRGRRAGVQLWDHREFEAAVVAHDPRRDLAALRIDASDLPAAVIADSGAVRPGELAIAVGNPLGFVGALSTGVIQAVGPLPGSGGQSWVQAGVRLAPGNSGGPLADARGRVIGVNTMAAGGLALAIPSNTVREFLAGGASDGWLGVTVRAVRVPPAAGRASALGMVLLEVQPGSPAALASLLPGDILLGSEEASFSSLQDLAASLRGRGPRPVRFTFLRGDYRALRRVTVRLGEAPAVPSGVAA